jgi:hypothetical protein
VVWHLKLVLPICSSVDSPDFIFMRRSEGDRLSCSNDNDDRTKERVAKKKMRAEPNFFVVFGNVDAPRVIR